MGKRGASISPETMGKIRDLILLGVPPTRACRIYGFGDSALSNRKKRDPEFAEQIAQWEAQAESDMVVVVATKAKTGNVSAAEWLLERRWPERWAKPEAREVRPDEDDAPEPDQRYL